MAYREVTMLEVKEALRRWLLGQSVKRIVRDVGVARNSVRRYIKAAMHCGMAPGQSPDQLSDELMTAVLGELSWSPTRSRGDSWAACEARRSFIADKLDQRVRLTKVHRLLHRHGVEVPYGTLYRFAVAELDFGRGPPSLPVADGEPGQEVQLDTGRMTLLEPDETGRRRLFKAWIFTAVHSRHRFVYPSFREQTADAIAACEAAWRFFGGVFAVVIPDNTKAIVNKADPVEPIFNEAFLEYAQARGFVIDPARVRKAKDKARVERSVQDVRNDCFGGERLRTIEDTHRRAVVWCKAEYGMRKHTRTQRLPLEHFTSVEQPCLKPAPTDDYDIPVWGDPKVGPDQIAVVCKALYSLPRPYRGLRLRARTDRQTVRFYLQRKLVYTAPRQPAGSRWIVNAHYPEDRIACANRDTAFLRRQAEAHGAKVGRFADALLATPLPWTRMRAVFALLHLCRKYGGPRVDEACGRALDAGMHSVKRLGRMLDIAKPRDQAGPTREAEVIPLARYLRPAKQYALPGLTPTTETANTSTSGEQQP